MIIGSRIGTWQGKKSITVRDYVQTGLIAMWDGIDNVGQGDEKHSYLTTVWKDICGNYDATYNDSDGLTWQNDRATITGSNRFFSAGLIPCVMTNNFYTCEAILCGGRSGAYQSIIWTHDTLNSGTGIFCFQQWRNIYVTSTFTDKSYNKVIIQNSNQKSMIYCSKTSDSITENLSVFFNGAEYNLSNQSVSTSAFK